MSNHNGAGLCAEIKARLTLQEAARMAGCNDLPEKIGVKFCSPLRPDRNPSCAIYRDKASGCYVMRDYSRGESYDAISLYAALRGIGNDEAPRELGEKIGIVAGGNGKVKVAGGNVPPPEIDPPVPVLEEIVIEPKASPKIEPGPDLIEQPGEPDAADFEAVRASRLLPEDNGGLELAHRLGVLRFGKVCGFPSWIVTDRTNRVAEARRLDGELYPQQGDIAPRKSHALRGSKKSWPAGLLTATDPERLKTTPFVLCEGAPDLLAAFCILAGQPGDLPDVQPLAMLGSSQSIAADALAILAGRGGVILAHNDSNNSGKVAAEKWAKQLAGAGCRVVVRLLPFAQDLNDILKNRTPARLAGILHAAPWRPEWPEPADKFAPDQPLPEIEEETFEPEAAPEAEDLFEDIGPYLDGTAEAVLPTVAEVLPGRCLFYREAVNEIHGEPSAGKTNVALTSAAAELAAGGRVLYLDPEDNAKRIVARGMALGADREAMRARFHYMRDPSPEDYARLHAWAAKARPDMAILDGLAEGLACEGKDENVVGDVLTFFRERIRPFAEAGAAVVIADHVAKNTDTRGRWARGSGAKLGHYNGASYEIVVGQAYAPGTAGFVKLKISKDRNGGAGPMGAVVAELHFDPNEDGGTAATWKEPEAKGEFRPTAIMDKIVAHLRTFGEASKRDLRGLGKSQFADAAIAILLDEGVIAREISGQTHRFRLAERDEKP